MPKLFSKDECVQDAETLSEFCQAYFGIPFKEIPKLEYSLDFGDTEFHFFVWDGDLYAAEFSCGVYKDIWVSVLSEIQMVDSDGVLQLQTKCTTSWFGSKWFHYHNRQACRHPLPTIQL